MTMRSEDLSALMRIRRGDVHSVCSRVLAQNKAALSADESAFLFEHRARLDAVQLARWLAFVPERPSEIVRLLCAQFGSESHVLLWHVLRWRDSIDRDAWAEITVLLAPVLAMDSVRALAYALRGCPLFDALVRAESALVPVSEAHERSAPLALAMIDARYDPARCEAIAIERASRAEPEGALARAVLVQAALGAWLPEAVRARAIEEHGERTSAQRESGRAHRAAGDDAGELDASALFDDGELDGVLPEPMDEGAKDDARFDRARIEWLAEHGARRRDLVAIALDRLASGTLVEDDARSLLRWLAEQLQTRSAWEQNGALILDRLLTVWRWDPIGRLVAFLDEIAAISDASRGESHPQLLLRTTPPPWTAALHEALARVIVERVETSLDAHSDARRAEALLEALVQLEIPPRLHGPLRALARRAERYERTSELVALHLQLCRRASPDVATMDGAIAALRDLAVLDAL